MIENAHVEMAMGSEGHRPVIRGTSIEVEAILRMLSVGANMEEFLESYPSLKEKDIYGALSYSADIICWYEKQQGSGA